MKNPDAKRLETAIAIAVKAHAGQYDKSGFPYILHPLRVMGNLKGFVTQQAGVLHDVVEDTDVTIEDLIQAGISSDAIEAIRLLTHDRSMSYAEYVCRLKGNTIAREVKLADLFDNSRVDRVMYRPEFAEVDSKRIQKYILTNHFLCDEIDEAAYRDRMKVLER